MINSLQERLTFSNPEELAVLFEDKKTFQKFLEISITKKPGSKAGHFPLDIFSFNGLVFDLGRICTEEGIDTKSDDYKRIYEKCENLEGIHKSYEDANLVIGAYSSVIEAWLKIIPSTESVSNYEHYWLLSRNYIAHYFWHFSIDKLGIEKTFDLAERIIETISSSQRDEINNILLKFKMKGNYSDYWEVEKFSSRENIYEKMVSFIIKVSEDYINDYPFEWILNALLPEDLNLAWKVSGSE